MNVKFLVAGTSVISLTAGTIAGYFLSKKKLQQYYDAQLEEDRKVIRDQYRTLYKSDLTPEQHMEQKRREEASRIISSQQYRSPGEDMHPKLKEKEEDLLGEAMKAYPDEALENVLATMKTKPWPGDDPRPSPETLLTRKAPVKNVEVHNIFSQQPSPHDIDNRPLTAEPYIISADEFAESDLRSTVFTYYEGDNTLADSQENQMDGGDVTQYIGDINLLQFGNKSGDSSVVYIRNPLLDLDIEINRDENSYKVAVAGLDPED